MEATMLWISLIAIVAAHIRANRKTSAKAQTAKKAAVLLFAAAAVLSFANTPGMAHGHGGDGLVETIGGHTVVMQTMGVSLPVAYRANGTMSGRMQSYVAAMAGESKLNDVGKWWIKGGKLCQRWGQWLDGKTYCFSLRQSGSTIHWTSTSGHRGTARISH
jgi:hypothetical protein